MNVNVRNKPSSLVWINARLHFFILITWIPSFSLLAQSFQPEVKGLDTKTFQVEVKGLSGASTQPNVQGLNNNTKPSQQSNSGAISGSSSGTSSSSRTGSAPSAGSEAIKSGGATGSPANTKLEKFFTCSRCGIEGAQAQGYCLGNFGMLTNTNGEPLKHVRK